MKHLILLYYFISFSTGFTTFAFGILFYLKYKNRDIKYYIILLITMTLYITFFAVEYYRGQIMYSYNFMYHKISRSIFYITNGLLFSLIPLSLHKFLELKYNLIQKIVFGFLTTAMIILSILYMFFSLRLWQTIIYAANPNFIFQNYRFLEIRIMNTIMFGIILYSCIFILLHIKTLESNEKKSFLKILLTMIFIFIPLWALELKWNDNSHHLLKPLTVTNLFYFLMNLVTIIYLIRYLFTKYLQDNCPTPTISILEPSDNFITKFNISEREKEIIILLAQGDANKQIAYKLSISSLTVKNHIYNIYKKAGVQSRVELVNLLSSVR